MLQCFWLVVIALSHPLNMSIKVTPRLQASHENPGSDPTAVKNSGRFLSSLDRFSWFFS